MIDVHFDVYSDTPKGKDPDTNSPTLRKFHQILWSKDLPGGDHFHLDLTIPKLLHHKSSLGEFTFSSDSICHTYSSTKSMKNIISKLPDKEVRSFFSSSSTIGGYIIFPSNKIDNKMTINGSRGLNKYIKDRFDLTLLCIKNYYDGKENPLDEVLIRYRSFFKLFNNFKGYTDFFLLNDLVNKDLSIKFFLPFNDFQDSPLPMSVDEYLIYKENVENFTQNRNNRITNFLSTQSSLTV